MLLYHGKGVNKGVSVQKKILKKMSGKIHSTEFGNSKVHMLYAILIFNVFSQCYPKSLISSGNKKIYIFLKNISFLSDYIGELVFIRNYD